MKYQKYLAMGCVAVCFLFFQNATPHSAFSGGIGGVAQFPEGLMVWGWACKKGSTAPVNVSIYFSKPSGSVQHWVTIPAQQHNTATQQEITALCGTTGSPHEFKVRLSYEDAVKFNTGKVLAFIENGNSPVQLEKYTTHPQTLSLDPNRAFTKNGWVEGEQIAASFPTTVAVTSFKGIPYAAPPVGNLRWAASVPPASWENPKLTKAFSAPCLQEAAHYSHLGTNIPASEDCLYLNVWKPLNKTKLPVVVYIHGGQFKGGWSGIKDYDGAYLASQDIVFVSFNYRVGIMGFFGHPLLNRIQRMNVNFGLTDQELALKWVKENIAEFGGDPNKVTLAGSSAG